MKTCKICKREFSQKATGRLRILRKKHKGESVIWICPDCTDRIGISE